MENKNVNPQRIDSSFEENNLKIIQNKSISKEEIERIDILK